LPAGIIPEQVFAQSGNLSQRLTTIGLILASDDQFAFFKVRESSRQ
jgi:hypothetical protein